MSASEDLGNLLKVLEEHLGGSEVVMDGQGFANLYASLVGIKRDVVELERQPVPGPTRTLIDKPWGNVVPLRRIPHAGRVS